MKSTSLPKTFGIVWHPVYPKSTIDERPICHSIPVPTAISYELIWDLVWQSRHFTLGSCHFAKTPSKGCVIHPERSTSAFHRCCESAVMLWIAMAECQFCFGIQFANVKLLSDRTNVTRISYETKRIWTRLEIEELRWLQVVLEGKVFSDYQHISVSPLWPCSSNRDKERDTFLLHGICSQSSRTIGSFLGFCRSICWTANTAQQASYSTLQYSTAEDLYWVNGKLQQNHVVDFITNDHESLWITIIIDWLTLT